MNFNDLGIMKGWPIAEPSDYAIRTRDFRSSIHSTLRSFNRSPAFAAFTTPLSVTPPLFYAPSPACTAGGIFGWG